MYLAFNKENLKLHDSRDKINCETINPSTGNLYTQSDLDKLTIWTFKEILDGLSSNIESEQDAAYTVLLCLTHYYASDLTLAIADHAHKSRIKD